MAGVVISSIILVVTVGTFIAQIVGGVAIVGPNHFIERDKHKGQFWFVIGIEAVALLIGILLFLSFQFRIFN